MKTKIRRQPVTNVYRKIPTPCSGRQKMFGLVIRISMGTSSFQQLRTNSKQVLQLFLPNCVYIVHWNDIACGGGRNNMFRPSKQKKALPFFPEVFCLLTGMERGELTPLPPCNIIINGKLV